MIWSLAPSANSRKASRQYGQRIRSRAPVAWASPRTQTAKDTMGAPLEGGARGTDEAGWWDARAGAGEAPVGTLAGAPVRKANVAITGNGLGLGLLVP